MLRLDLARLDREGSVQVEARVPADDPMWQDVEPGFSGAVDIHLRASTAGSGEIVVRGSVESDLRWECRRCLAPVEERFAPEVTMVFLPSDTPGLHEEDEARVFDARAAELDLSESVREEVILAIDPYVVCDPECKGLCPRCGTNRNVETCDCTTVGADPRWEVLRALKEE